LSLAPCAGPKYKRHETKSIETTMKKHLRYLMLTVLLGGLLASQSAFAGECCTKTAKATKAGKTCAACETQDCCKKTAQKVADSGKAKPCETCAAKKKEKS
jgi:hypothetical protein